MAGYELATAYVNLVVETRDIGKQIGGAFKGADQAAATGGTAAGKAFAKAFDQQKPVDLKGAADKAAAQVDVASKKVKKAREVEEAAARKVAIEEAKLAEQRSKGTTNASTILATEDRLARAKSASALASENVESALRSEQDAKTRALAVNDQLEASQREVASATEDTGQKYLTLKDRIKAAVQGDFKGAFQRIPEEAEDAADEVPDKFDGVGQSSASKFGAAFKRMLGPILAAVSAGAVIKVGFQGAMELQASTKTLTGLYNSAEGANDMMRRLKDVAKDSPLELAGYAGAAETLAYAGVQGERAADVLDNVGKAIVTAGGDTTKLDQAMNGLLKGVNNGGIAMMDSLGMISESGVPILSGLAAKFGTTTDEIKKMASGSKISVEDVLDVMQNGTGDTFEQMISASAVASGSLQNQWKLAKDRLSVTLGEAFMPLMDKIAPMIGPVTDKLANGITGIVNAIMAVTDWMERWKGVLTPVAFALTGVALAIGVYALATNAATIATNLASSAIWKMTAAFLASPMGWLVIAIGAVVGALVWFFTKTETGAALWDKIWAGIKVAAGAVFEWFKTYVVPLWNTVMSAIGTALNWVWSSILKPVFGFLVALWKNVLAPTLKWLWNSVFKPVFNFIGALISTWWAGVKVIFNALITFWKNVLWPTIKWLKDTFQAIFLLIGAIIKTWWNTTVKPVFNAVRNFVRDVLGPIFKWLYNNIIKPVWDGIGSAIKAVWNNVIKPVFQTLGNFIKDKVAPKFKGGVDAISKAWDGLKEAAKKPVRFVINKVINEGIIDRFNDIADKFPGTKDIKHLSLPKGFRSGGKVWGAGTETSDSIPARLSRNEHVLTAKDVRNLGGHGAVYKLRAMAAKSKHRGVAAFRNGGAVGVAPGFAKGGTLSDAARWLQSHGVRITEFKAWGQRVGKHSNGSLHYSGRAFDANAGPGGENATEKAIFDRLVPQLNAKFPALRTLWRIPHHFNHLHVDTGRGGSVGTGGPGAQGDSAGLLDLLLSPFNKLKDKLGDQFARFGTFGSLAKGAGSKAIDAPIQWIKANISKVTDFVSDTWEGAKEGVTSGAAKTQARAWAAANNIPWNGARMSAMRWIIKRESNWNPRAQNPRSTASGLPQFINSTAKQYMGVAPAKNYSVWKQLDGMMKYVNGRYGGAVKAKEYWQRNNHYRHGGAVTPQLFDGGGLLKRGVQLVEHRSSKPDRVLSDQQWNGIYQAAVGGGNNNRPIIQVTTPTVERNEVGAWLDELEFSMTHLAKSNAFSGVNG